MKNLKIVSWLCLILFVSFSGFSQIKGIVKDSISGQPIPYVNIWVENGNIGTTSDEIGTFIISAERNQKLVFSAVGFEPKKIKVSEAQNVLLKEIVMKLDEVVVQNLLRDREITIGTYNRKEIKHFFACNDKPWVIAKYFAYDKNYKETPFLKNITLMTETYTKGASFNLRLIEANPDGTPGNNLLDENIIVKTKRGSQDNNIDLIKYKIRMPENGIFLAYEFLIIEENKFGSKIKGQKELDYTYDPILGTIPSDVPALWIYSHGEWAKSTNRHTSHVVKEYVGKYTEPAMILRLTN